MRIAPFGMLVLCGCYVTTPVATNPAPAPGSKLHIQLTDAGSASLAQYLGPNVFYVDGRLVSQTDTGMAVSVNAVTLHSGNEQYWKGETVSLPQSSIATVQEKRISWWRSGVLAGGIMAVLGTIGAVSGSSNGNTRNHGPPPPPQ